jgi:hypothetical protein
MIGSQNNPLPLELRKKLYELSLKLPPVKRLSKKGKTVASQKMVKMRGDEILNAGITNVNGETIDPKKFYRLRKPVVFNHFENLEYNFVHGGEKAVEQYVKSVQRAALKQVPLKKKVIALVRYIKSKIKK